MGSFQDPGPVEDPRFMCGYCGHEYLTINLITRSSSYGAAGLVQAGFECAQCGCSRSGIITMAQAEDYQILDGIDRDMMNDYADEIAKDSFTFLSFEGGSVIGGHTLVD